MPLIDDMRSYGTRWLLGDAAEPARRLGQPCLSSLRCKAIVQAQERSPGGRKPGACVTSSSTNR